MTPAQIDSIYDSIDSDMRAGRFAELDAWIATIHVKRHGQDFVLSVLSASLPAKKYLPARGNLFAEFEKQLRERGEYEQGLLAGLEQ